MLLNESLKTEVRTIVKCCDKSQREIAEELGVTPQVVNKMLNRDYELGKWIDILDSAGYDVAILIKPKKKSAKTV